MQSPQEREAARAQRVREKVRQAAEVLSRTGGDPLDGLVEAWPHLRPLFANAVPGQVGLTDAQRLELQAILASMGGRRGAGANGPHVRRLEPWEALKVADRIRSLASSLPPEPSGERAAVLDGASSAG